MLEDLAPGLRLDHRGYLPVKRALDIAGSLLALCLLGPAMIAIAIVIRLDSPGSALFVQAAIGRGGRAFRLFKFRSMYSGTDNAEHQRFTAAFVDGMPEGQAIDPRTRIVVYKIVNDARITRVGRLLRRSGLDELPQLMNVLLGHMSLVGPRPPLPYEYSLYNDRARRRLVVRPGITGLYQVYKRSRVTFGEMVETDLEYVQKMSLMLDLKLLFLTLPVLLKGQGAY